MLLLAWLSALLAIAYPMLLTLFAWVFWDDSARGSLLVQHGKVRGSVFIAQNFTEDKYFWPRASASDFATLPSRGIDLRMGSEALAERVEKRREYLSVKHSAKDPNAIPADLLFDSASGIDPDLMLPSALFQVDRVAKARGLDTVEGKQHLYDLVMQAKVKKPLNLFGRDCINVLLLNQSLDNLSEKDKP